MGSLLALLARRSLLHEERARPVVPRAGYQGRDRCRRDPPHPFESLSAPRPSTPIPWRAALGLLLFALGLGFAIWARVHIGRNWGTPMTQKDDPELVTSGPYHLVRHPIYTGILVAGVGTAVALSWLWLIAVILAGVYFVYSATVEERYMTRAVPRRVPGVQGARPRCCCRSSSSGPDRPFGPASVGQRDEDAMAEPEARAARRDRPLRSG